MRKVLTITEPYLGTEQRLHSIMVPQRFLSGLGGSKAVVVRVGQYQLPPLKRPLPSTYTNSCCCPRPFHLHQTA